MIKELVISMVMNPTIQALAVAGIMATVGYVIHKIRNAKAEEKFHAIEGMIANAFNIAEKTIPDNTGPAWLQKADQALKVFNETYAKRYGKEPEEYIQQFAKDAWSKIALELKKN